MVGCGLGQLESEFAVGWGRAWGGGDSRDNRRELFPVACVANRAGQLQLRCNFGGGSSSGKCV